MSTKYLPCIIALMMLGSISQGYAQEDRVTNSIGGEAYEITGSVKYFSIPSKLLFVNREFLNSQIVNTYTLDEMQLMEQHSQNCAIPKQKIELSKVETQWWSRQIYKMEILGEEANDGDILGITTTDINRDCNVQPRQFVVDRKIIENYE